MTKHNASSASVSLTMIGREVALSLILIFPSSVTSMSPRDRESCTAAWKSWDGRDQQLSQWHL